MRAPSAYLTGVLAATATIMQFSEPTRALGGADMPTVGGMAETLRENWSRLAAYDQADQSYRYVMQLSGTSGKSASIRNGMVNRHGNNLRIQLSSDGTSAIGARNPHYEFSASLKEGRGWVLATFDDVAGESYRKKGSKFIQDSLVQATQPLSGVDNMTWEQFLTRTNPRFQSIESLKDGHLRIVGFSRPRSGRESDADKYALIVDPKHSYCVLSFQTYKQQNLLTSESSREIEIAFGRPVCKSLKHAVYYPPGNTATKATEIVIGFDDFKIHDETPEIEFYLTHYGLPEPAGVVPPSKPYSWAFITACTAFVLGIAATVIYYIGRRRLTRAAL